MRHRISLDFWGNRVDVLLNSEEVYDIIHKCLKWFVVDLAHSCTPRAGTNPAPALNNKIINESELSISLKPCQKAAVLFSLTRKYLSEKFLFFHGAAVEKDNKGMVFIGPHDSGKTMTTLFAMGKGYKLLSDELVALSRTNHLIYPYPIPLRYTSLGKTVLQRYWPDGCQLFKEYEPVITPNGIYVHDIPVNAIPKQKIGTPSKLKDIFLFMEANNNQNPAFFLFDNCFTRRCDSKGCFKEMLDLLKNTRYKRIHPIHSSKSIDTVLSRFNNEIPKIFS